LDADWIRIGSAATSAKIRSFTVSSAMLVVLCARMLVNRARLVNGCRDVRKKKGDSLRSTPCFAAF
jgi:hypothetical protein